MAASKQQCELCKSEIPDQIKATANRKYCPTCFSIISKQGINEAMKIRGNVATSQEASQIIIEQDIRNLAAGLMAAEDFADVLAADIAGVAERLYKKTGWQNVSKREEIMNHLTKWVIDMQPTAVDMDMIRCCECSKAYQKDGRVEIPISSDEMKLLQYKREMLIACNNCHAAVKKSMAELEAAMKEKGVGIGIDFNNLSLSKAILLGGLNPYHTPSWVTANPNCWKYIHPAQEAQFIGKLVFSDQTFMGNSIIHGESQP